MLKIHALEEDASSPPESSSDECPPCLGTRDDTETLSHTNVRDEPNPQGNNVHECSCSIVLVLHVGFNACFSVFIFNLNGIKNMSNGWDLSFVKKVLHLGTIFLWVSINNAASW